MSIFQEVILKLISSVCEAHIRESVAADKTFVGVYTRNLELSASKREVLRQLLISPKFLKNNKKNDLERLGCFQTLVMQTKDEVVKAAAEKAPSGTTEQLLDQLSDSLKLSYDQFERLGLLNLAYYKDDPLILFYTQAGLYYAKKMLRSKQQPSEQGSYTHRFLNVGSFLSAQEQLFENFFGHCQCAIKSFDQRLNKAHESAVMLSEALYSNNALKSGLILSFIYRLGEQHDTLCSGYLVASHTAEFKFFREALVECLDLVKQELKALSPCGNELKHQESVKESHKCYVALGREMAEASEETLSEDEEGASAACSSTRKIATQLQPLYPEASLQSALEPIPVPLSVSEGSPRSLTTLTHNSALTNLDRVSTSI